MVSPSQSLLIFISNDQQFLSRRYKACLLSEIKGFAY
jgi:hypothetical protein